MALSEARRKQLEALVGGANVQTPVSVSAPSTTPLAPVSSGLTMQGMTVKTPQGSIRLGMPTPPALTQQQKEESAVKKTLQKKAADQKLQLEQAITIFSKIFDEADDQLPVIGMPQGTLPAQKLGRWAGREMGLREEQRGAIESFRARATPALKALGEVGVLTDQDIQRMLTGGFPSDNDSETTRRIKREGLISDFQSKLNEVNRVLGVPITSGKTTSGLRYTVEE